MKNENYFKALTGYRAMAAFMVFIHHFEYFSRGSFLDRFFIGFSTGVPLFFVLSGFLIYTRYQDMVPSLPFYKKYMINRFARIYPLYFLITTITLFYLGGNNAFSPHWLKVYLLNITFLRGFFSEYVFSMVAPGWTLTVEEVFYILAPIIFLIGSESIRRYLAIFLVFLGFGWLVSYVSIHLMHGFFWADFQFFFLHTFFGHSFAFIVGIIVGVLHKRLRELRFKFITWVGFAGLILSLVIMSQLLNFPPDTAFHYYTPAWIVINNFLITPFIGAIIWGLIRERTMLSRVFSTSVFQILGKSSYAFYLLHFSILTVLLHTLFRDNIYVYFIFCIVISILLWHCIEEPVNRRIRKSVASPQEP